MDMSNFRPELHVAQQSRRDKLRIQHDNSDPQPHYHNFSVYANNLDHLHAQDGLNYNSIRTCRPVGNICYDPSEMLNFSANSQGMLSNQDPEKRVVGLDCSFDENNFSRSIPNNPSGTVISSDQQYFSSTWKSIGSQSISCDWLANQSPIFVGEGLSGSHHQLKIASSTNLDVKPNYQGYNQELHETPNNPYQNALQELVTSSNVRSLGLEFASLRQKGSEENSHGGGPNWFQWSGGEMDYAAARDNNNNNDNDNNINIDRELRINDSFSNTQALSLSLSSVPSPKVHATQIASGKENNTELTDIQEYGKMMGNQGLTHRNPGPLGPFTGYATILRSSKFLRPAQQLMDELCCMAQPKHGEVCEMNDKNLGEVIRVSGQVVCNGDSGFKGVGSDISGGSSFAFSVSCDKIRETGGMSYSMDSYRPENLQKKAKLVFMQDEVCKKYKQYHQQMQMVVSSFETVSGLSAATPYVSIALKMVSKHFRGLKNAITDQLKGLRNALGEDLSSPSSNSKGDGSVSMLKFFDQSFQKQKGGCGGGGRGILEGHHIWRPQRGLPEHAVSILRAWLFDHFLHPYPTDTDKHMLATQTGLTRNQVSNWFINARVRVWKPMVEEIHMLETKGVIPEGGSVSDNAAAETTIETHDKLNHDSNTQSLNKPTISPSSDRVIERSNGNMWKNQEKRSRVEYHGRDGPLMGWVPSHRPGNEMGPTGAGLGAVSLTLGLMQSVENAQQEQHHHLRTRFGGQIIRDFVG